MYEDQPLPLGRTWVVTARARVEAAAEVLPKIRLGVEGQAVGGAAVTARVQEGRAFTITVEFEDPVVPAWDPVMHPSSRRKLEKQRTVWSTHLASERAHIDDAGLDVRVDTAWDLTPGWVLPAPRPGFAMMGDFARFPGWHVLVLRGAVSSFGLQAPAWWGPADRSPAGAEPGQVQPADGTLVVTVALHSA